MYVCIHDTGNTHIERLVSSSKFFLLVGSNGTLITYERSDDKHEPYIESRRLSLGGNSVLDTHSSEHSVSYIHIYIHTYIHTSRYPYNWSDSVSN